MTTGLWLDRWILARAGLYEALLGLSEETLARRPVCGTWTAKDVLAHCAGWEARISQHLPDLSAGKGMPADGLPDESYNARQVALRAPLSLAELLAELGQRCASIVATLDSLGAQLATSLPQVPWGEAVITVAEWAAREAQHYAEHAAGIRTWRKAEGIVYGPGPRGLLEPALDLSRQALERLVGKMPLPQRDITRICGEWTLKDVIGHLADWEAVAAEGAALAPKRGALPQEPPWTGYGLDAWNAEHVARRSGQPWEVAWAAYEGACRQTDAALATLTDVELAQSYPHHYATSPYAWLAMLPMHNVDHAAQVVAWLEQQEAA